MAETAFVPLSSLESRILSETGMTVVFEPEPDAVQAEIEARLAPLATAGDLGPLAEAFDALYAARTFSGTGYRTYRIAQSMMLDPIEAAATDSPKAAQRAMQRYRKWWLGDRTNPAAAATYARALITNGYPVSVHDTADASVEAILASLKDACGEARRVLAHAGPNGRKHWLWRQADFTLTFVAWSCGMEDEDALQPAFAAVQKLDPFEFGIYDDRAGHLLPHWAGSMGAIDKLARAAASRTTARFGDLLYARIYDTVLGFEDAEATKVDPARFLAALGDWYERFPSQALANRYAAHAHAFGDYGTLRALFRGAVREIQPSHWFDNDQPLEAWRAVSKKRRGRSS